jgi:hypothetical protein
VAAAFEGWALMTEAPIKNEEQVSELCVKCGFCCSGVIYDYAGLEGGEVDFAGSIGLTVATEPDTGKKKFNLPCPHLCGTACSIYRERKPAICSRFFCELATKLDRGEIGPAESLAKVQEAQALMEKIKPMLLPGENWVSARARWNSNRHKAPRDPKEAEFQLLMTALNLFLDRNFRKERQRLVPVEEMK